MLFLWDGNYALNVADRGIDCGAGLLGCFGGKFNWKEIEHILFRIDLS